MRWINILSRWMLPVKKKYKSGVLNFISKLSELPNALEDNNEQQISYLLHSVRPLSAYLNLTPLNAFLSSIEEAYKTNPAATKHQLLSYIREIETYVGKM